MVCPAVAYESSASTEGSATDQAQEVRWSRSCSTRLAQLGLPLDFDCPVLLEGGSTSTDMTLPSETVFRLGFLSVEVDAKAL